MSHVVKKKALEVDRRTVIQNATLAIRDVYDALVELVTNADDRYQILGVHGRIEIEVEERRSGNPSVLRVRDFADGMTSKDMEAKLARMGGRVSGLETGQAVRGTNSRGAKDIAALGRVTFESIAVDGRLHVSAITPFMEFELYEPEHATSKIRERLGILEGTGTVVTLEIDTSHRIPRHEALVAQIGSLVRLRDIVRDPRRTITLRRGQQGRQDQVVPPLYDGKKRLSVRFGVPEYEGTEAKLVIYRSSTPFERAKDRFRHGGILVKSRHAIHEATLFDPALESDPCALWFYGRLTCEAIDDLWNAFDERYAQRLEPIPSNPVPILDPSRKSGLTRDHPFVAALYGEALKRLRPLIEEERRREEHERSKVESRRTRSRLDALERAANEFMREWSEEDEDNTRDPDSHIGGKRFREHGFMLSPPFAQIVRGHSLRCSLSILQDSFPELETGATVQVERLTPDVETSEKFVALEPHPVKAGVLRGTWSVKALQATPATGVRARVGPIVAESTIEVFASEADRYRNVRGLTFSRKRYQVRTDKDRKRIQVLAPVAFADEFGTELRILIEDSNFRVSGSTNLISRPELGVAVADFYIKANGKKPVPGTARAILGSHSAEAEIIPVDPPGTGIHIKLEDVDHGSMRYRWRKNELEIAARHPSLARYLGSKAAGFPGQEERHFRVLLAEIVADAVCSELLRKNIEANPTDYENADWDLYYAEFSEYMTHFLPKAHALVVPDP